MVIIKLVSYLKTRGGFSEKEFKISKPTKIRDLVSLNLPNDRLVIIINQTEGGTLDTEVYGDMHVMISPVFGGGKED